MRISVLKNSFVAALFALGLAGCLSSISPFSETAYQQATALKAQSLLLMDEAAEPYAPHAAEVAALNVRLHEAYEYAAGRPQNEDSAKQWALLIASDGNLLGGFFRLWKKKDTLDRDYIDEKKKQVAQGFDEISGLESGKNQPVK